MQCLGRTPQMDSQDMFEEELTSEWLFDGNCQNNSLTANRLALVSMPIGGPNIKGSCSFIALCSALRESAPTGWLVPV